MFPPHHLYTQIKWSGLDDFFHHQCRQYLALQEAGSFTDIILQCKDGSVALHQAVLLPLSKLLASYSTKSSVENLTDIPMVLILPDYDLSTAQSLIFLLYTGRYVLHNMSEYE